MILHKNSNEVLIGPNQTPQKIAQFTHKINNHIKDVVNVDVLAGGTLLVDATHQVLTIRSQSLPVHIR